MTVSRRACLWGMTWGCATVLSAGALVYAFNPQPDPPGHYFGALGLVSGQGLALNVANRKLAQADDLFPPDPCRADLRIVDAGGQSVARHTTMVMPGESVSLNFTADPPGGVEPPDPDRQMLRAFVLFKGESAHCLSSLEITDMRGQSQGFMNPGSLVGFNPQPDPPGAPFKR